MIFLILVLSIRIHVHVTVYAQTTLYINDYKWEDTYVPKSSLVPRPSASSAPLTFELARNQKSGGESGEFYHVSDVKGREKVLGR